MELHPVQKREREHRSALTLSVRVDRISTDTQAGLHQSFNQIHTFPDPRTNEVAERCDVVVADMSIRHRARLAVTKVHAGKQVVIKKIVGSTVGSHCGSIPPVLRQIQVEIQFVEFAQGPLKHFQRNVATVGVAQIVRGGIRVLKMPGCLSRTQTAAHREGCLQIPLGRIVQFGLVAADRSKVAREVNPMLDVLEAFENLPLRHAFDHFFPQLDGRCWNLASLDFVHHRPAVGV